MFLIIAFGKKVSHFLHTACCDSRLNYNLGTAANHQKSFLKLVYLLLANSTDMFIYFLFVKDYQSSLTSFVFQAVVCGNRVAFNKNNSGSFFLPFVGTSQV